MSGLSGGRGGALRGEAGGESERKGPVLAPLLLDQFTIHIFPEVPGGISSIPPHTSASQDSDTSRSLRFKLGHIG